MGHHAVFAIWRLQGRLLESIAEAPEPSPHEVRTAARLYDMYSLLLLYTGRCSAERYAATVRAEMTDCHPAFSGAWAPDHQALPGLMRRVRARHPHARIASLTEAARLSHHVHMAVAKKLVPNGPSLLQQAGRRPAVGATRREGDLYDAYFRVRRQPVCRRSFSAQLIRRLAQITCDTAAHGLSGPDAPPARLDGRYAVAVQRFERDAPVLLRDLAEALHPAEPPFDGAIHRLPTTTGERATR
ncbi:hypothetical protein ACQUSR_27865 [Streptomyces sp. P1-3]|uniref:hypothetical protein n=1 Tax=Streptomyces sp. P1-3 TaxID=3421658 RepID=UPI003D35EEB0